MSIYFQKISYKCCFPLDQIEFSYNKQKLIVTSMEGLITSRIIKEFIEKRYSSYVSQVEFYNLYEMRKLDFT